MKRYLLTGNHISFTDSQMQLLSKIFRPSVTWLINLKLAGKGVYVWIDLYHFSRASRSLLIGCAEEYALRLPRDAWTNMKGVKAAYNESSQVKLEHGSQHSKKCKKW